ncbi:MAG: diguanylate cyclase [Thermodesulfovibrionales bacterium]
MTIILSILCLLLILLYYRNSKRLKELNLQLEGERRKIRELAVLNDISSLLYTDLDERSVIETIVDKAKELIRSEFSAILLVDKGKVSVFYTSIGDSTTCKSEAKGILLKVLRDGLTIRTNKIESLSDFNGLPTDHPVNIKSILIIPLLLREAIIGEIILANRIGKDGFSESDEDVLLTFGFHAAFALEKARLHQEVRQLATIDGLTGLYNHRAFQEKIETEIERARRFGSKVSLLMMDIDNFKRLNDTYGHNMGDEVLRRIGCKIVENVRHIDFAARYGGEEFAVVLPETNLEGAKITAERIREAIKDYRITHGKNLISVTVSIGVSTYPDSASSRMDLIEKADSALYEAKRSGKDRVCSYKG